MRRTCWALILGFALASLVPAPLLTLVPGWRNEGLAAAPRLAYIHEGDVYVISPGGRPLRLTRGAGASTPRWSADGRWVSYFAGDWLWIASTDGRRVQRVADLRLTQVRQAAWAPRLPLLAYVAGGQLRVAPVDLAGAGAPRRVHMPAAAFGWSPDGNHLVVAEPEEGPWPPARTDPRTHRAPGAGLVVVPLEGEGLRDLLRLPDSVSLGGVDRLPVIAAQNLAWSPGGDWIAFHLSPTASLLADANALAAIPAAGGELELVDTALAYPEWVRWLPDGTLAWIGGAGRDAWSGKYLAIARPPAFRPERLTPDGAVDRDFAWSGGPFAVARSGDASPRDRFGRPLPAIYVNGKQISRPRPPDGDYAPYRDRRGRLYWVRISDESALVMAEGKPWVPVDAPDWYYGHWFVGRVLDWWEAGSEAR